MQLIYIAGPFRAPTPYEQEQNIRSAEALALKVWKRGAACICPHTNTRFFQGAAPDAVWLDGDLEMVLRVDAVLMTPDWERSVGARAEREFALKHSVPVLYSLEELDQWLVTV